MARALASRGVLFLSPYPVAVASASWRRRPSRPSIPLPIASLPLPCTVYPHSIEFPYPSLFWSRLWRMFGCFATTIREYRKPRSIPRKKKKKKKQQQQPWDLDVKICIEEDLPDDPEVLCIAETLKNDVPMAVRVAFDRLKESEYTTRDTSIGDNSNYEKVELAVLLCNNDFIQKLNKDWRGEDHATDVLSMSQHVPELGLAILLLGDIVISVETAARQAQERGHMLLDEIRILMVHGLLHLLGFDHEISIEAEVEMEEEEEAILQNIGWKGKGLINRVLKSVGGESLQAERPYKQFAKVENQEGSSAFSKIKLSYLLYDVDGILGNGKAQTVLRASEGLREAISQGIEIIVVSGKSRSAIIRAFSMVNIDREEGIVTHSSPGVFLQGAHIYGRQGQEIYKRNLDQNVCREALVYSLEHEIPLVAFSQERCFTLFEHPSVEILHTVYHEPKVEIIASNQDLLAASDIQKLLFLDTADKLSTNLRPFWSEALEGRARVIQSQPDMLEIIPSGSSKPDGVKILLEHLGISIDEGSGGVTVKKTNLCFGLWNIYDESMTPGQCIMVVERLGDYLYDQGF